MNRRHISLAALVALLTLLIAACSGATSTPLADTTGRDASEGGAPTAAPKPGNDFNSDNGLPDQQQLIVYTGSLERAERVGRAVRAGTVWVNTFLVRDLTAPFGGIGISGIGREGGDYALDFYSDLKTLQILEGSCE